MKTQTYLEKMKKENTLNKEVADIFSDKIPTYSYKMHGIPPFGYYEILYDGDGIYAASTRKEARETVALLKGAFACGFIAGRQ